MVVYVWREGYNAAKRHSAKSSGSMQCRDKAGARGTKCVDYTVVLLPRVRTMRVTTRKWPCRRPE